MDNRERFIGFTMANWLYIYIRELLSRSKNKPFPENFPVIFFRAVSFYQFASLLLLCFLQPHRHSNRKLDPLEWRAANCFFWGRRGQNVI
jgi:hypothetical protein